MKLRHKNDWFVLSNEWLYKNRNKLPSVVCFDEHKINGSGGASEVPSIPLAASVVTRGIQNSTSEFRAFTGREAPEAGTLHCHIPAGEPPLRKELSMLYYRCSNCRYDTHNWASCEEERRFPFGGGELVVKCECPCTKVAVKA